ncbi:TrgA family protein [Antarcticimicrobium sediminis]|uniref:TrgA family protein n=1 Tax=Antarcticimicrobium sediminis TaxID=2546227 RepID=A0A4R5EKQ8_9RHOB|nr:TrgA family protein [Antarcticimicrobium sediminis]TDE35062.1 TrgA family protein [Antarcticimicrobium sediminis]
MPTAARLVAACCLALLAFTVSYQIMARMPESTNFGIFVPLNIGLGVVCGWVVMGRNRKSSFPGAMNNGIAGVAVLVFWGLVVQGGYEMFRQAMNHRYHGPLDALYGIIELSAEYAQVLLAPGIIVTLVVGAILSGFVTGYASKTWR